MRSFLYALVALGLAGCATQPQTQNAPSPRLKIDDLVTLTSKLPPDDPGYQSMIDILATQAKTSQSSGAKIGHAQVLFNRADKYSMQNLVNEKSINFEKTDAAYARLIDTYKGDDNITIIRLVTRGMLGQADNILKNAPSRRAEAIEKLRQAPLFLANARPTSDDSLLYQTQSRLFSALMKGNPDELHEGKVGFLNLIKYYTASTELTLRVHAISALLDLSSALPKDSSDVGPNFQKALEIAQTLPDTDKEKQIRRVKISQWITLFTLKDRTEYIAFSRAEYQEKLKSSAPEDRQGAALEIVNLLNAYGGSVPRRLDEMEGVYREMLDTFGKDTSLEVQSSIIDGMNFAASRYLGNNNTRYREIFIELETLYGASIEKFAPKRKIDVYEGLAMTYALSKEPERSSGYLKKIDAAIAEMDEKPNLQAHKDEVISQAYVGRGQVYLELGAAFRPDLDENVAKLEQRFGSAIEVHLLESVLRAYETRMIALGRTERQPYTAALPMLNRIIDTYEKLPEPKLAPYLARARVNRAYAHSEVTPWDTAKMLIDSQWVIERHLDSPDLALRRSVGRALLIKSWGVEANSPSAARSALETLLAHYKDDPDPDLQSLVNVARKRLERLGPG